MKRWLTINMNTSEIAHSHNSEDKPTWVGNFSESYYKVVEAPSDILESELSVAVEDGEISFSTNSPLKAIRVQSERDAKLDQIRALRDQKLSEADVMVNELVLEIRADKVAVKDYRQALLDYTNIYKKLDGHARASIDNVDLEDLEWPTEP